MANAYSRTTKLKSIGGRSDYISNPNRQEYIVLHEKNMEHEWSEYAEFEKQNQRSNSANNQGREIVIALPNDLSKSPKKLQAVCDSLSTELLGNNRDYEYAVHWNESKTNLHMHLIFSERERNTEREPKRYKRDMWYDKTTNKMAKAHSENAELRYKKGEIMRDKEGHIRYDDKPFTVKDPKFKSKQFLVDQKKVIQSVFKEYDFSIQIFNPKQEIAQKKLYKGSSKDYKDYARKYNEKAREHNTITRSLNKSKPISKSINDLHKDFVKVQSEINALDKEIQGTGLLGKIFPPKQKIEQIEEKKAVRSTVRSTMAKQYYKLAKIFHVKTPEGLHVNNILKRTDEMINSQFKKVQKLAKELKSINTLTKYKENQKEERLALEKKVEQKKVKKDRAQSKSSEKKEPGVIFSSDWVSKKQKQINQEKKNRQKNKKREQEHER